MKVKIPDSFVLILFIIIVLGLASYIIPSGNYEREIDLESGVSYVVPDSYKVIEKEPMSIFEIFKAIPKGMINASDIVFFVLLTGGTYSVINATGTINTVIGYIVKFYAGREKRIIPIIMIMFSMLGAVLGIAEESLPFYPLIIALALSLGFDRLTGVAMVLIGTGAGFVAGVFNPFTTGVAQIIAELPLFSGLFLRFISYIVFVSTSIIYVYRHASKTKESHFQTLDNDFNERENSLIEGLPKPSPVHFRVIVVLILSAIFLLVRIVRSEFHIIDLSTTFIIIAIIAGVAGGLSSGRIVSEFVKGASNLMYGALIVGLARGVFIVMQQSNVMDTVIYQLSKGIDQVHPILGTLSMFIVHGILDIFIGSGSGQASMTMPIMKALADTAGITRQTSVLAFQFGDGFTNLIYPTSGYFMAVLAIGGIDWNKWVKWIWPLFLIWCLEASIILAISCIINYGPF